MSEKQILEDLRKTLQKLRETCKQVEIMTKREKQIEDIQQLRKEYGRLYYKSEIKRLFPKNVYFCGR